MNITELEERLRNELRRRIGRGQESVSRLSRKSGLGQSHLSNFLRGKGLSVKSLDRLLAGLELDVEKLAGPEKEVLRRVRAPEFWRVPVVTMETAMWESQPANGAIKRLISVRAADLAKLPRLGSRGRLPWRRFVAIELSAPEVAGMDPVVVPGSVVVVDRHYNSLKAYERPLAEGSGRESGKELRRRRVNLYLVKEGTKLVVRYAFFKDKKLMLKPYQSRYLTTFVEMASRTEAMELLAGRVVFLWNESLGMVIEVDDLEEDGG